ncbi:helix-turn-helix domain-containing protein [Fulvivirga sedimenti]|uniref:AraC family transcriptional regulator n=1 Tax=Fulvivirga sedimenti TaxID=2879465 RepID=A0A9X1L095_9BACT|nr:AraC family transcriptional regulator [Fulvivirga sedimenti]MCA6074707.1 AraC family transcriptional regulator [Fulvivirga sedimenti]MCA6075884.1 AraC family transcriptional regulator [Fulvivirga sedimenti]MCA6077012.1 AraC family transcriptional regulator [Fulvivirga sedimenti]
MIEGTELVIKNMVCPRCIQAVKSTFLNLDIPVKQIDLGKVIIDRPLQEGEYEKLAVSLKNEGFELLEDKNAKLVTAIKNALLKQIHSSHTPIHINFSSFLSDLFNHEYSYLSRLFSSVEGITIERYIIRLKVEKVKELLTYEELTLTEIADQLEYSSVSHLSSQFKKETGMTPSDFKALQNPPRSSLDEI